MIAAKQSDAQILAAFAKLVERQTGRKLVDLEGTVVLDGRLRLVREGSDVRLDFTPRDTRSSAKLLAAVQAAQATDRARAKASADRAAAFDRGEVLTVEHPRRSTPTELAAKANGKQLGPQLNGAFDDLIDE